MSDLPKQCRDKWKPRAPSIPSSSQTQWTEQQWDFLFWRKSSWSFAASKYYIPASFGEHTVYSDLSVKVFHSKDGEILADKVRGNDSVTAHVDWRSKGFSYSLIDAGAVTQTFFCFHVTLSFCLGFIIDTWGVCLPELWFLWVGWGRVGWGYMGLPLGVGSRTWNDLLFGLR